MSRCLQKQDAHQLVGQTKRRAAKIRPKPSDAAFGPFWNFYNCQPEVVRHVIPGMAEQDVGMDVCCNVGDSTLKPSDASFSALFERRQLHT